MASSTRTVKAKFDGDAKGLVKATKEGEAAIDRFGKSVDKKFRKSGDDASKSFGSSVKRWFKGDGAGLFSEIGKSGGTVFGSGLLGALKTPILGPAILGLVAAAAATAAPAAGAIVASGLVAGAGAGLAGLGLVFAAKNAEVKAAWSKTLTDMGARMQVLSKPFESTLIAMSVVARRTFDRFAPLLGAAFEKMAPAITAFGDQMGRAFEELAPAVAPLADAFTAVVRSLGPATQAAVRNVSEGLQDLAESVKRSPDGLADLVRGAGDLVRAGLDLVRVLNDANAAFERITRGTSLVDVVMGGVTASVRGTTFALQGLTAPITGADALLQKLGLRSKDSGASTDTFSSSLDGAVRQMRRVVPPAEAAAAKFDRQKKATDDLIASMFRLQNLALGLSGAQINYQASVDAATASVKANGKTLDTNTEKGRNNRLSLDALAASANEQTQKMIESGEGNRAAGRAAEASRATFIRLATQMGLSKKEAEALAKKLIAIPPKKNTNVTVTGATGAKGNVDALANSIRLLPGYKTIQIRYTQSGVNLTAPSSVGRRASGGLMQPGRDYLTSERGQEIIRMGRAGGARVISAEHTPRELASGSQPIVVENHIEIGGEVVRVVKTEIKANDRNTNRRVTAGVR